MINRVTRGRAFAAVAAAGALSLTLAACGGGSSSTESSAAPAASEAAPAEEAPAAGALSDIKVAAVIKDEANPFFGTIAQGMRDAAAEHGVERLVRGLEQRIAESPVLHRDEEQEHPAWPKRPRAEEAPSTHVRSTRWACVARR